MNNAIRLIKEKGLPTTQVALDNNIPPRTLRRYLRESIDRDGGGSATRRRATTKRRKSNYRTDSDEEELDSFVPVRRGGYGTRGSRSAKSEEETQTESEEDLDVGSDGEPKVGVERGLGVGWAWVERRLSEAKLGGGPWVGEGSARVERRVGGAKRFRVGELPSVIPLQLEAALCILYPGVRRSTKPVILHTLTNPPPHPPPDVN